jgi:hypothetical protein
MGPFRCGAPRIRWVTAVATSVSDSERRVSAGVRQQLVL